MRPCWRRWQCPWSRRGWSRLQTCCPRQHPWMRSHPWRSLPPVRRGPCSWWPPASLRRGSSKRRYHLRRRWRRDWAREQVPGSGTLLSETIFSYKFSFVRYWAARACRSTAMITRQSENSKLKFKQTAFLATVYNISTPFPVRHAQSLLRSCNFHFSPRQCMISPLPLFLRVNHGIL